MQTKSDANISAVKKNRSQIYAKNFQRFKEKAKRHEICQENKRTSDENHLKSKIGTIVIKLFFRYKNKLHKPDT